MPCAHADAMYSKCAVAPRIRQPRQMTAANVPASGRFLCRERNLERARHLDDADVVAENPGRLQPFERAGLQAIGDEVVELRHDDRELQTRRLLSKPSTVNPSTPSTSSASLNSGFALLEKRLRPFLHVLGRRHHAEQRRFEPASLGERHLQSAVDGLHRVPQRDRRLRCQLRRERLAPRSSGRPPAPRD